MFVKIIFFLLKNGFFLFFLKYIARLNSGEFHTTNMAGYMIRIVSFLSFLVCSTIGIAQGTKLLSVDELINGKYRSKTLLQPQWRGISDQCTWIDNDILMTADIKSSKPKELLSLSELNKQTGKQWASFPQYQWIGTDTLILNSGFEYYRYSFKTKKIDSSLVIDSHAKNINPNNNFEFAYTIENNLYLAANKTITALTNYKEGVIVADEINRKEFNTEEGMLWSPSGKQLAFMEKSVKGDEQYPQIDYSVQPAKPKYTWYPFAGGKNEIVRIGVYNLATKTTKYLSTGKADQYLTNLSWSADEKSMTVVIVNREQNKLSVRQYSVETGEQQAVLLEEKADKYIEPEASIFPVPNRQGEFLWLSERNGFNHLYHYTTDGQILGQITNGNWQITKVLGFNAQGDCIYFEGTTEANPEERHLYRANIFSLDVKCLTTAMHGTHEGIINPMQNTLLDFYQSIDNPGSLQLIDSKNTTKQLKQADNPFTDYVLGARKIFTIKSKDGTTDLYSSLILPPNFDSTKKYPVIVNVYGGPHIQQVINDWLFGSYMIPFMFANSGYVVFTLDNRGSANRGINFEQQTWHQLGTVELEDQNTGLDWLCKQQFVDTTKIATYGWSFGGYMSINLLTSYPNRFACGVAGSPVCNWQLYEVMYTERYMGTPASNAAGYEKSNLIPKAKYLKAPLYIINGGMDFVTVPQHSISFINECIANNISVDYLLYPSQEHNLKGKDAIHNMNKIIQYYNQHLLHK